MTAAIFFGGEGHSVVDGVVLPSFLYSCVGCPRLVGEPRVSGPGLAFSCVREREGAIDLIDDCLEGCRCRVPQVDDKGAHSARFW